MDDYTLSTVLFKDEARGPGADGNQRFAAALGARLERVWHLREGSSLHDPCHPRLRVAQIGDARRGRPLLTTALIGLLP